MSEHSPCPVHQPCLVCRSNAPQLVNVGHALCRLGAALTVTIGVTDPEGDQPALVLVGASGLSHEEVLEIVLRAAQHAAAEVRKLCGGGGS